MHATLPYTEAKHVDTLSSTIQILHSYLGIGHLGNRAVHTMDEDFMGASVVELFSGH